MYAFSIEIAFIKIFKARIPTIEEKLLKNKQYFIFNIDTFRIRSVFSSLVFSKLNFSKCLVLQN